MDHISFLSNALDFANRNGDVFSARLFTRFLLAALAAAEEI